MTTKKQALVKWAKNLDQYNRAKLDSVVNQWAVEQATSRLLSVYTVI